MPYTVLKLAIHPPIVVVHFSGELNGDVYFKTALKVADLVRDIPGKVYRITDCSNARLSLLDMLDMVAHMTRGWQGTASDPRIISLMVLSGGNSSLAAQYLNRTWEGWRQIRVFPTMAEALACARGPISWETEEPVRVGT